MRRLPRTDTGQVHPEGGRQDVARQVPPVQRLQDPTDRQVFRQERAALLQGRLFQVSIRSDPSLLNSILVRL